MSLAATSWAWAQTHITAGSQRFVLLALADHCRRGGRIAYPSQGQLATMTGLTDRTIRGALRGLLASGAIRLKGKKGTTAVYELAITDVEAVAETDASNAEDISAFGATPAAGDAENFDAQCGKFRPAMRKISTLNPEKPSDITGIRELTGRNGDRARARRRVRKPDLPLPPNWQPNLQARLDAEGRGLDFASEAERFRAHHAAKGSLFCDWDAAFRTWMLNAVRWAAERAARTQGAGSGRSTSHWGSTDADDTFSDHVEGYASRRTTTSDGRLIINGGCA